MVETERTTEQRLRRAAERQRLRLERSRRRDTRALDYGTYQLRNTDTDVVVHCATSGGYGLTLDQIEAILNGEPVTGEA